jgi:hypothetical protein
MKTIIAALLAISLVACGPSNQPQQQMYQQPQTVSSLDGQQVYSHGQPVFVNGQPVIYEGGTPVIIVNGQPQVVVIQQPQYYDNTGNLIMAGMVGYALAGGFSSNGYYRGSGGWTGGSYSHQTIVNKTVINKTYVTSAPPPRQMNNYKPQQRPTQVAGSYKSSSSKR